ncbi:MAG: hypothetical protein AAF928_13905 [Myxococcota bacterium]
MRSAGMLLLVAATATAGPTRAEEASAHGDTATERAIAAGRAGKSAFDAGRFEEAREHFAAADAQAHSPVFVLYRGRSERALGQWRAARRSFLAVAAEQLDGSAPAPWREAVVAAQADLARIEAQIPQVRIKLDGAQGGEVVRIDGRVYPTSPVRLDPGAHALTVTRGDTRIASLQFRVKPGERRVLSVEVLQPPSPRRTRSTRSPIASPSPDPPPDLRPSGSSAVEAGHPPPLRVAGYTLLGVGGAGLVTGIVTGVLALDRASAARQRCGPTGRCDDDDDGERTASERFAHVATATFIVGGVSTVAGLVLAAVPLTPSPRDENLKVRVGWGTVSISGHFH